MWLVSAKPNCSGMDDLLMVRYRKVMPLGTHSCCISLYYFCIIIVLIHVDDNKILYASRILCQYYLHHLFSPLQLLALVFLTHNARCSMNPKIISSSH